MNTLIPLTEKDLTLKVECWLIESAVAWLQLATSRLVEFIALQMLEQYRRPRKLPTQRHINCNAHAAATTSTTVPPEATTFSPSEGSASGSNCSVSLHYLSCCALTHILSSLRSRMGVCSRGNTTKQQLFLPRVFIYYLSWVYSLAPAPQVLALPSFLSFPFDLSFPSSLSFVAPPEFWVFWLPVPCWFLGYWDSFNFHPCASDVMSSRL